MYHGCMTSTNKCEKNPENFREEKKRARLEQCANIYDENQHRYYGPLSIKVESTTLESCDSSKS